jgi:uncharacterized membrane-anchored protein
MLISLIFIFCALLIGSLFSWIIDNNGSIIINWLGYEITTDILTILLILLFILAMVFAVTYLLARILSLRFPFFLKFFSAKSQNSKSANLIKKHFEAIDLLPELLVAIEIKDDASANNYQKRFSKLIKNPNLNNFLLGKIASDKKQFLIAEEYYRKITQNKLTEILIIKLKIAQALEIKDEKAVIAYAKQILELKKDDLEIAKLLFALYKKNGDFKATENLIDEYGIKTFSSEIEKRDIVIINSALANTSYQKKEFFTAIKYCNIALKIDQDFLPALEIKLKSYIKMGFAFRTRSIIKDLWQNHPNLILAEIFDLTNHKSSPSDRIVKIKKLAKNQDHYLDNLAIGLIAFKNSDFETARQYLLASLKQEKTSKAYKLLASSEKFLAIKSGFDKTTAYKDQYIKYIKESSSLPKFGHYICSKCFDSTTKWSPNCTSCKTYDSYHQ